MEDNDLKPSDNKCLWYSEKYEHRKQVTFVKNVILSFHAPSDQIHSRSTYH